jgi:hypothetical protein
VPRPRKPLEMLELTGHYRSDRHSQRRHAPKSDRPIGDPPACLAPDGAACWREFVGNAPAGVLTSGDRVALEVLSRLAWSGQRKRPVIPCADLGGDTEYGRQVARGGGRGAETRLG